MINKRWKKTLSIMLSAAMVFSMNNVSWAKTKEAPMLDGGNGRLSDEQEPEVFPEAIDGEAFGAAKFMHAVPDDGLNVRAKKDEKVKDFTTKVTFAEGNKYYAINTYGDSDEDTNKYPFWLRADLTAAKDVLTEPGRIYMDLTIGDHTYYFEDEYPELEDDSYVAYYKVENLNDYGFNLEAGKSYTAKIRLYGASRTDFDHYDSDEGEYDTITPVFYEGEQKITFAADTVTDATPYVSATKHVLARATELTVTNSSYYDPDTCKFLAINIPGGIYTGGDRPVLELVDSTGKVVGRSRRAQVHTANIYDEQYGKELASELGFTREVTQVYGTVQFFEYLETGKYTLRAIVNNESYEVENAVDAIASTQAIVETAKFNKRYDYNGDFVYVNVTGINIDPTKIVPVISQSDNTKAYTSDTPEVVVEQNNGFVYKLKKTADADFSGWEYTEKRYVDEYDSDLDEWVEVLKDVKDTSYDLPLSIKKLDSSYDVEIAEEAEHDEEIKPAAGFTMDPYYNWKTNELEIKGNLFSGDEKTSEWNKLEEGDTIKVAISEKPITVTSEPIKDKNSNWQGNKPVFDDDCEVIETKMPADGVLKAKFKKIIPEDDETYYYSVVREFPYKSGTDTYYYYNEFVYGRYDTFDTTYYNYDETNWDSNEDLYPQSHVHSQKYYDAGTTTVNLELMLREGTNKWDEESPSKVRFANKYPANSKIYPAVFYRDDLVYFDEKNAMSYAKATEVGTAFGKYTATLTFDEPLDTPGDYQVRYYPEGEDPRLAKDVNDDVWAICRYDVSEKEWNYERHVRDEFTVVDDKFYVDDDHAANFDVDFNGNVFLNVNALLVNNKTLSGNDAFHVWKDGNYDVEIFDNNYEPVEGWSITGYSQFAYEADAEYDTSSSYKSSYADTGFGLRIAGLPTDVTGYYVRVTKDGEEPLAFGKYYDDEYDRTYDEAVHPYYDKDGDVVAGVGEFAAFYGSSPYVMPENYDEPHAYYGLVAGDAAFTPVTVTAYDKFTLSEVLTITADESDIQNGIYNFTKEDVAGAGDDILFCTVTTPLQGYDDYFTGYLGVGGENVPFEDDEHDRVVPETIEMPEAVDLGIEEVFDLEAVVTPEESLYPELEWKSSNATVATVSDGKVTAVAPGIVDITATAVDGGATATCKVTVIDANFEAETATVEKGDTIALKFTVSPDAATEAQKSVSFSSADEKIAKVDEKGVVTGVGIGSTKVTLSSNIVDVGDEITITVTETTAESAPVTGTIETAGEVTIGSTPYEVTYNASMLTYNGKNLKKMLTKAVTFRNKLTGATLGVKKASAKAKTAGAVTFKSMTLTDGTKLKAADLSNVNIKVAPRKMSADTMKNKNGACVFGQFNASKSKKKGDTYKKIKADIPNFGKNATDVSEASLDSKKSTKTVTIKKTDIGEQKANADGSITITFTNNFTGTITIK